MLAEIIWWRDNAHRIPWIPPAGDGSRYDRMIEKIDSFTLKTKDEVQRVRNENQKERITPYRPSIDPQLAKLFEITLPTEANKSVSTIVDWSFPDKDGGQPSEPADWVKKHIQRLERWGENDSAHQEMIANLKERHRWTHNIPPPSMLKRYDPNEPPFIPPPEFFDGMEGDDENDM